jgi:hypothetical protein
MLGKRHVTGLCGRGVALLVFALACVPTFVEAQVVFPIKVSADGRHLEDSNGAPFSVQATASWSLITQLSLTNAETYLEDRRQRGFNTVIVNIITSKFTDGAPRNAAGVAPFTTPNDFSTPNDAYFAHAEQVLQIAAQKGFLVFLTPAYFGFDGGDEGWFQQIASSTPAKTNTYGRYLGTRFRSQANVAWLLGGDYSPPAGSTGENNAVEMANGIRATDRADRLYSYHGGRHTVSRDQVAFRPFVNVNAVYSGPDNVAALCRSAYNGATMPTFLIEAWFENEHGMTPFTLRKQAYWAITHCTAGQTLGNAPIWNFGAAAAASFADNTSVTWQTALNWPGSREQTWLFSLVSSIGARNLEPDQSDAVITAGMDSGANYASTGVTADKSLSVTYVPTARSLTVNLGWFGGPVTLSWFDPTSGNFTTISGSPFANTGTRSITTPGANADGAGDWVIVGRTAVPMPPTDLRVVE